MGCCGQGREALRGQTARVSQVVAAGRQVSSARAYFLIVEPRASKRAAVRAFADWLIEQARGA